MEAEGEVDNSEQDKEIGFLRQRVQGRCSDTLI